MTKPEKFIKKKPASNDLHKQGMVYFIGKAHHPLLLRLCAAMLLILFLCFSVGISENPCHDLVPFLRGSLSHEASPVGLLRTSADILELILSRPECFSQWPSALTFLHEFNAQILHLSWSKLQLGAFAHPNVILQTDKQSFPDLDKASLQLAREQVEGLVIDLIGSLSHNQPLPREMGGSGELAIAVYLFLTIQSNV